MQAEIITIGDEILIGQIVDTNSQWLGKALNNIGVSVYQITSIQDDKTHILNALAEAESRADIVLITGGLGPTKDDITKKTLATYFNDSKTIEYPEVIAHIKQLFKRMKHPFKPIQLTQAQLPASATLLMNTLGTAPGMWFFNNNTVFISLPGVPYEMKGLMQNEVLPRLQQTFKLPYILHKTIITYGQGESTIAETIEDFENSLPKHIKLAYLPSFGKVRLRLSSKGLDKHQLEAELNKKVAQLYSLLPDIIAGIDDDAPLEKQIGQLLLAKKQTLSTAESLTGGKIAANLVAIPGASGYFKGSTVAYTEAVKIAQLNVKPNTIERHTTVSKQVALEMAKGALKSFNTDVALAVTGNAGPTTDNNDKTLGLVYIAIVTKTKELVHEFNFGQPREKVIQKTVNKALELLRTQLV